MPRAIPVPIRRSIWRRCQRGQPAAAIAEALQVPLRTVHHLVRRFRHGGTETLPPSYGYRRQPAPEREEVKQAALSLRRQHLRWGASFILVNWAESFRPPLPSARTLQRWFRQAGLGPAPRGCRFAAERRAGRATRPHEVWQMDAAERVRLGDGRRVSWLRMTDESSGAIRWTRVFPPRLLVVGGGRGGPSRVTACVCPLGTARAVARR